MAKTEEVAGGGDNAPKGPVSRKDYIDEFQDALQAFEDKFKAEKFALLSVRSSIGDLRSQRALVAADVEKLRDTKKAFDIELSDLTRKVEERRRELRELVNT